MKILVAGASGFIGGRLCEYFADEGFEVIALVHKNIPNDDIWKAKMAKTIQVDLSADHEVSNLVQFQPDAIINLVSLDHNASNGIPQVVSQNNVLPTWNLLHYFSKQNLKKFIYLSTIHVYGNRLKGIITENALPDPQNMYGLTHLLSEELLNFFAKNSDTEYNTIRFANGYGAPRFFGNNCWEIVINNLCLSAWKNQHLVLKSDGTPLRDFIHISDLLIGIKHILTSKVISRTKNINRVINFSSKNTRTILDAAIVVKGVYEKKYGRKATVFINNDTPIESYKRSFTSEFEIDNSLFLELLDNRAIHDLEYGIDEIFNYLDNNQ